MDLKQLLSKVEFDNVAPFIVQHYPELAHCMAGFKMAFDGMRNTVPTTATEEQIKIELMNEDNEEPYLDAFHAGNDVWENVVGREVIVADNVRASMEEIAAVILYDATFYGFTPDNREETFSEWEKDTTPPRNGNPYRIKWWHLTQKEHDSQCQKKDIGTRYYTADLHYLLKKKPMNRAKRKRAYRWEKRIDELDRLANRWDLLQKIKRSIPENQRSDINDRLLKSFKQELFKASRCEVICREDFSADGIGLPYIYELLTKYDKFSFPKAGTTLLWFQSPNDFNNETLMNICLKLAWVWNPLPLVLRNSSGLKRTKLTIVRLFQKPDHAK